MLYLLIFIHILNLYQAQLYHSETGSRAIDEWSTRLQGKCDCFKEIFQNYESEMQKEIVGQLKLKLDNNTCFAPNNTILSSQIVKEHLDSYAKNLSLILYEKFNNITMQAGFQLAQSSLVNKESIGIYYLDVLDQIKLSVSALYKSLVKNNYEIIMLLNYDHDSICLLQQAEQAHYDDITLELIYQKTSLNYMYLTNQATQDLKNFNLLIERFNFLLSNQILDDFTKVVDQSKLVKVVSSIDDYTMQNALICLENISVTNKRANNTDTCILFLNDGFKIEDWPKYGPTYILNKNQASALFEIKLDNSTLIPLELDSSSIYSFYQDAQMNYESIIESIDARFAEINSEELKSILNSIRLSVDSSEIKSEFIDALKRLNSSNSGIKDFFNSLIKSTISVASSETSSNVINNQSQGAESIATQNDSEKSSVPISNSTNSSVEESKQEKSPPVLESSSQEMSNLTQIDTFLTEDNSKVNESVKQNQNSQSIASNSSSNFTSNLTSSQPNVTKNLTVPIITNSSAQNSTTPILFTLKKQNATIKNSTTDTQANITNSSLSSSSSVIQSSIAPINDTSITVTPAIDCIVNKATHNEETTAYISDLKQDFIDLITANQDKLSSAGFNLYLLQNSLTANINSWGNSLECIKIAYDNFILTKISPYLGKRRLLEQSPKILNVFASKQQKIISYLYKCKYDLNDYNYGSLSTFTISNLIRNLNFNGKVISNPLSYIISAFPVYSEAISAASNYTNSLTIISLHSLHSSILNYSIDGNFTLPGYKNYYLIYYLTEKYQFILFRSLNQIFYEIKDLSTDEVYSPFNLMITTYCDCFVNGNCNSFENPYSELSELFAKNCKSIMKPSFLSFDYCGIQFPITGLSSLNNMNCLNRETYFNYSSLNSTIDNNSKAAYSSSLSEFLIEESMKTDEIVEYSMRTAALEDLMLKYGILSCKAEIIQVMFLMLFLIALLV